MAAGRWSTPLGRVGSSLSFFSHCRVRSLEVDAQGKGIGEVIIVILGVTCEFLVAISKHEILRRVLVRGYVTRMGGRHWKKGP